MAKSCAIVGNGKSALDLPADIHMPLFGMNYSPITPDYYVCVDSTVLTHHWREIYPLAERAKIAYLSGLHVGSSKLYDLPNAELVYKDTRAFKGEHFMSGCTATYVCLKMCYYLGFDEVHLWGIDHDAAWTHFRDDYPSDGDNTTPGRFQVIEWHYALAAQVYGRADRVIINHSARSRLDSIFRRAV